jgi:D-arabinose 1-dehydrogenase-like Zn-dependent alcohol dehydrogenase
MKAAILKKANETWHIDEVNRPDFREDEILIKVKACGLCYSDVHMSRGDWGDPPIIPGHEVVGEVVSVGANVTNFKVHDRVGLPWDQSGCGHCSYCIQGKIEFCSERKGTGLDTQGGFAEYLSAPSRYFVKIPNSLSYAEAAPLICAGYTVYGGLYHSEVRAGQNVGIIGIGGLGHLGIQYARAFGARVFALTRGEKKFSDAIKLGAHDVINIDRSNWDQDVLEKGGLDVILSTTPAKNVIKRAIKALKPEGTLVLQGEVGNFEVDGGALIEGRKKIVGSVHGPRNLLSESLQFAADNKIKPLIEMYNIEEINHALKSLEKGDIRYRAVINIDS